MTAHDDERRCRELSAKLGRPVKIEHGWIVLQATGRVITSEMVRNWQDEIDREEAERAAAFARGELPSPDA
jgi:hypothetical protein